MKPVDIELRSTRSLLGEGTTSSPRVSLPGGPNLLKATRGC